VRLCPTQVANVGADKSSPVPVQYFSDVKSIMQKSVGNHDGRAMPSSEYLYRFEFLDSMDAVRCAVQIHSTLDKLNKHYLGEVILLSSIGVDLGMGKSSSDLTVNPEDGGISAFLAKSGSPGEISLSEGVYLAIKEKGDVFCRFTKQLAHNGARNRLNVYAAFWNPTEIEINQARIDQIGFLDPYAQPIRSFGIKLILLIVIILAVFFSLIAGYKPVMHLLAQIFSR
jgi:hypothetical protein